MGPCEKVSPFAVTIYMEGAVRELLFSGFRIGMLVEQLGNETGEALSDSL